MINNHECVMDLMFKLFVIYIIYNYRKHPFVDSHCIYKVSAWLMISADTHGGHLLKTLRGRLWLGLDACSRGLKMKHIKDSSDHNADRFRKILVDPEC
jgi:hypothetical protein